MRHRRGSRCGQRGRLYPREDAGNGMGSYTLRWKRWIPAFPARHSARRGKNGMTEPAVPGGFPASGCIFGSTGHQRGGSQAGGRRIYRGRDPGGRFRPGPCGIPGAKLTVSGGAFTVTIAWSSSNYDYMVVDGVQYDPVNTEGNSVFELPLTAFDTPVAVQADTIGYEPALSH